MIRYKEKEDKLRKQISVFKTTTDLFEGKIFFMFSEQRNLAKILNFRHLTVLFKVW